MRIRRYGAGSSSGPWLATARPFAVTGAHDLFCGTQPVGRRDLGLGGAGADNAPPAADGKADIASPIKSQGAGPSAAEERSEIAAAIEIDNEADIQRYRESERITND